MEGFLPTVFYKDWVTVSTSLQIATLVYKGILDTPYFGTHHKLQGIFERKRCHYSYVLYEYTYMDNLVHFHRYFRWKTLCNWVVCSEFNLQGEFYLNINQWFHLIPRFSFSSSSARLLHTHHVIRMMTIPEQYVMWIMVDTIDKFGGYFTYSLILNHVMQMATPKWNDIETGTISMLSQWISNLWIPHCRIKSFKCLRAKM